MLEYIGWKEAADAIVKAMEIAFESAQATRDLARFMEKSEMLGTIEFGECLIKSFQK